MERIYAICKVCGSLVCREPGKRHGDGQQDTDDNPVWLLDTAGDDEQLAGRLESVVTPLPTVNCGCND